MPILLKTTLTLGRYFQNKQLVHNYKSKIGMI